MRPYWVFFVIAALLSCGTPLESAGFSGEPTGVAGIRWKTELPKDRRVHLVASVLEQGKKVDLYRIPSSDTEFFTGDNVILVFVNGLFYGANATTGGRGTMEKLSKDFTKKFGPPPPDPSGGVTNDGDIKIWVGETCVVSIQYDDADHTTSIAILSKEMVESNPELLTEVEADPGLDDDQMDKTEAPICVDTSRQSLSPYLY